MTLQVFNPAQRERSQRGMHSHGPLTHGLDAHGLSAHGVAVARHLRGIVLLGGAPRRTALAAAVGRSVLDLPIAQGRTLIEHWLREIETLRDVVGMNQLPVRLALNHQAIAPTTFGHQPGIHFQVERDPIAFRGMGGLLHDLGRIYQPDDLLLVITAGQIPLVPIARIVVPLLNQHEELSLSAEFDGTVGGAFLISVRCLREIPGVGFIDFKEQALPRIAAEHVVTVVRANGAAWHPVRTIQEYIHALRHRHLKASAARLDVEQPPAHWQPVFSIVEDGARVHRSAKIYDAVILRGAILDPAAKVTRTVVASGINVGTGEHLLDWTANHDRITI